MSWFAHIVVNHRVKLQAIHSDILALYIGTQSDILAVFKSQKV